MRKLIGPVLVLACSSGWAQQPPAATGTTDDRFIGELATGRRDEPVDRGRLAELFARLASALARERRAVEVLQQFTSVPEPERREVSERLAERYGEYARSLDGFLHSSSELVSEPNSRLSFYRVFLDGQRTCWTLDLYGKLIETWGAGGSDLRAILPSRAACGRFRTALFLPRVGAILEDALIEQVYQRDELRRLEQEIHELEKLVDDLMKIDAPQEGSALHPG